MELPNPNNTPEVPSPIHPVDSSTATAPSGAGTPPPAPPSAEAAPSPAPAPISPQGSGAGGPQEAPKPSSDEGANPARRADYGSLPSPLSASRPEPLGNALPVKFRRSVERWLEKEAKRLDTTKSQLIRHIVEEKHRGKPITPLILRTNLPHDTLQILKQCRDAARALKEAIRDFRSAMDTCPGSSLRRESEHLFRQSSNAYSLMRNYVVFLGGISAEDAETVRWARRKLKVLLTHPHTDYKTRASATIIISVLDGLGFEEE